MKNNLLRTQLTYRFSDLDLKNKDQPEKLLELENENKHRN